MVLIIHWEGNVFEKNREFGFLIDDRASPEERVALEKIFTGYAGGAFEAWRDLTLKLDGVQFVPMTVTHDAENWRVEVPGMVDGLGGPFRKYMVPEGDTCRIYNAPRPEVVPGFLTVGQAERHPGVRDRAIFVGNPDDIIPHAFGKDLPAMRDWVPRHFDFAGYVIGEHPGTFGSRAELRERLGYRPEERVCIVTVGGSASARI